MGEPTGSTRAPASCDEPGGPRRFAAFVSYRHTEPDESWARWLHSALETYRVPRALRREGVPPRLGRVYRDQEELGASTHLSDDLRRALEASESLIVVCSPRVHATPWMDREVRHFCAHGAGPRRIFALLIEGDRATALPQALRELGEPRWGALDLVPIDVRPKAGVRVADQRRMAHIALAAAMLGRPYDELRRRDDERRRRTRAAWSAGALAVLAVVVGFAAWGASGRRAAEDASESEADARGDVGNLARTLVASLNERLRPMGRLDALQPAVDAVLAYDATLPPGRRNHETQRTRVAALLIQGDARLERGDVASAEQSYAAALAALEDPASRGAPWHSYQADLSLCHDRLGSVCNVRGELEQARVRFERSRAILSALGQAHPGDAHIARYRAVNANKLGDLLRTMGDAAGAEARFAEAQALVQRLAQAAPESPVLQADLAVGYDKLGSLWLQEGRLAEAGRAFADALAIARRLAADDPRNSERLRDVSVSLDRVANVRTATGDGPGARDAYLESLGIARRLAEQDPLNLEWQRDLSVSLLKLGDVRLEQGELGLARESYVEGLAISARLSAEQPSISAWQRDLSVAHDKLGVLAQRRQDHAAAQQAFEQALAIRLRMFERMPGDVELQERLFDSHFNVAATRAAVGDIPGALASFHAAAGFPLPGVPRSPLQQQRDADLAALVLQLGGRTPPR